MRASLEFSSLPRQLHPTKKALLQSIACICAEGLLQLSSRLVIHRFERLRRWEKLRVAKQPCRSLEHVGSGDFEVRDEDETLGPWMKQLTSLKVADGAIHLTISPQEAPPAMEAPPVETRHVVRAAVLGGLVILAFVGFMFYAAKKNRELKEREPES